MNKVLELTDTIQVFCNQICVIDTVDYDQVMRVHAHMTNGENMILYEAKTLYELKYFISAFIDWTTTVGNNITTPKTLMRPFFDQKAA